MQDSYEPLLQSEAAGRYSAAAARRASTGASRVRPEDRPQSMAAMREAIGVGAASGRAPSRRSPTAAREGRRARPPASCSPRWLRRAGSTDGASPAPHGRHPALSSTSVGAAPVPPRRSARMPSSLLGGVGALLALGVAAAMRSSAPGAAAARRSPRHRPSRRGQVPVAAAPAARPWAGRVPASAVASPTAPRRASPAWPRPSMRRSPPRTRVSPSTLEAPAGAAVGNDLTLSVRSKSDGLLYFFVWDQAGDRIYRLTPEVKEGGNAIKADGSFTLKYRDAREARSQGAARPLARRLDAVGEAARLLDRRVRPRRRGSRRRARRARGQAGGRRLVEPVRQDAMRGERALRRPLRDQRRRCRPGSPAPPPVAKRAPAAKTVARQNAPGKKTPDSEREYMKRLNKDLDNLLGK